MKTITAGDTIKINVEADDKETGIKFVEVEASNIKDTPGSSSFEVKGSTNWLESANNAIVELTIPEYIPSTKWKVTGIVLINGAGRTIKYSAGKDFEPILFTVKHKEGVDLSPAKLISVSLVE